MKRTFFAISSHFLFRENFAFFGELKKKMKSEFLVKPSIDFI